MNNQKDIQKTGVNSYGHNNVLDEKGLNSRHIYEFANKKTEKLVTALYMVTDCMDTEDALKGKLRALGVGLLSDMYKLSSLTPQDKHTHISSSIARVDEILSFIEIAYTIGFISEMNTTILKKEFMILMGELESHQNREKHFTFTLDEQMFSLPVLERDNHEINNMKHGHNVIKDKRTNMNNMSFMNPGFISRLNQPQGNKNHPISLSDKKERIEKILDILKDKEVSIKDISSNFTDCSEKTIQRELNALVSKGQIKKTGSKRWSKYTVASAK